MAQNFTSAGGDDKGGVGKSDGMPNWAKKFMKEYRTPLASAMASSIATGTLVSG